MRVLITGAARSGSSLVREVVRGLNIVSFPVHKWKEEDREFFKYKTLPQQYGTKLTVENKGFTLERLVKMMERYGDLRIVFSHRHPVDNCMAKIVRGQPASKGGDSTVERLAADASVEGAIVTIKRARSTYREIMKRFPTRVYVVQMENLILYPKREVQALAAFLGIDVSKKAFNFYKYNTNLWQKKRYGRRLDKSQVGVHKRWNTAYGGFFKNREEDIKKIRGSFNG